MSRVVVARGGASIEREVSLRGARRVSGALRAAGHEVSEVEIDDTLIDRLRRHDPAFVFIVAHGRDGEDGSLQSLLELLAIPYTGSDPLASAVCLDKVLAKQVLRRAGLPTPAFQPFSRRTFQDLGAAGAFGEVMDRLGAPVVVKPARLGSSFGIKYVAEPDGLRPAVLGAVAYDDTILVERHVTGRELAVTVLGGDPSDSGDGGPGPGRRALPIVEILGAPGLYDYEAHYDVDAARLEAPARLDEAVRARVEEVALAACATLGCRDIARVDCILDADDEPQILEVNSIPGLTETGPTPVAAEAGDMDFGALVAAICARVA